MAETLIISNGQERVYIFIVRGHYGGIKKPDEDLTRHSARIAAAKILGGKSYC